MLKVEYSFLFDEVMKDKEKKIEEMKDKVIEQIAQALIFIAKEIYQKEKESNMPSKDFGSAFYFNSKDYGNKNNRNRICASESK